MTTGENCTQHAPDGMVNTKGKMCGTEGCGKFAAFGVAGTKSAEYCIRHSHDGAVDVCSTKYTEQGCGKLPSFGVADTRKIEYCALDGMFDVRGRMCGTEDCGKQLL